MAGADHTLLDIVGLSVDFTTQEGIVHAVDDVSFAMAR